MSEGASKGGGSLLEEFFVLLGVKADHGALDKFREHVSSVRHALEALGVVAAFEAGKRLMEFVEHAIDGASQTQDLSEALGLAATEIAAFTSAGMKMGIETQDMVGALDGVTRAAGAAAAGFPRYTKLFEQLFGAKGAEEAKKSTDEIFSDIADKFETMDARTRLAVAGRLGISGKLANAMAERGGAGFLEMVQKSRKASLLSDEDFEKADKAKIQFELLHRVIGQVVTVIGMQLVPFVKRAMELFLEWWGANRRALIQRFVDILWVVIYYVGVLWNWFKKIIGVLGDVWQTLTFGLLPGWWGLIAAVMVLKGAGLIGWLVSVIVHMKTWLLTMGPIVATIALVAIGIMGLISIYTQMRDNAGVILNWMRDAWRGIVDEVKNLASAILKIPGVKRVVDYVMGDTEHPEAEGYTDSFLRDREKAKAQKIKDEAAPDWIDASGVAHWKLRGGNNTSNKTVVQIDEVNIKADKGRESTVGQQLGDQVKQGIGSVRNAQGPFKS